MVRIIINMQIFYVPVSISSNAVLTLVESRAEVSMYDKLFFSVRKTFNILKKENK